MNRRLFLAFCVLLAGCATEAGFATMMNTWIGLPDGKLVAQWGAPQSVYPITGGGRVLSYSRGGAVPMGAMLVPVTCNVNVTVGDDGRIQSWTANGNNCKAK